MIQVRHVLDALHSVAPALYQESYDNVGLQIGHTDADVKGILTTLDVTDAVLQEAIKHTCNVIVTHHPLIFKGLKKITNAHYSEKLVHQAIKNDLNIIATHTNIDNTLPGLNTFMASKLGLIQCKPLLPTPNVLKKLQVFVPADHLEKVAAAMAAAGAGKLGNYDSCSFRTEGTGTFRPLEGANPYIGTIATLQKEKETKLEVIFPKHLEKKVLQAMYQEHPYEEVAYDIWSLDNHTSDFGSGIVGNLPRPTAPEEFIAHIKTTFGVQMLRYTEGKSQNIKKVAFCGGAGAALLPFALAQACDAYITADAKYHDFFEARYNVWFMDIGHYESEYNIKVYFKEIISNIFPNIAVIYSKVHTNPVSYA